jgi:hypothetical protein
MKETCGRQSTFREVGGFGQRKDGVVWGELVGDGLELNVASCWDRLDRPMAWIVVENISCSGIPCMRRDSPSGMYRMITFLRRYCRKP